VAGTGDGRAGEAGRADQAHQQRDQEQPAPERGVVVHFLQEHRDVQHGREQHQHQRDQHDQQAAGRRPGRAG
jgi:hypothetical protein